MMMDRSHHENSFPVNLKDITCIITETVSKTNNPPIMAKTISCLTMIATAAKEPPKEKRSSITHKNFSWWSIIP